MGQKRKDRLKRQEIECFQGVNANLEPTMLVAADGLKYRINPSIDCAFWKDNRVVFATTGKSKSPELPYS